MPKNPQRHRGLMTNVDAKDVPPGYNVVQRNIGNFRPGRLDVRKGLVSLFAEWGLTPSGSEDYLAAFAYIANQARWIVLERTDGVVKAIRDGAQSTIVTGLNVFQPLCFVREQFGNLIFVNGIERGYRWDGIASAPVALGIGSPEDINLGVTAHPRVQESGNAGNLQEGGVYLCGYRYIDADGVPSSMSDLTQLTIGTGSGNREMQWIEAPNLGFLCKPSSESRVLTVEFWRTVANDRRILYKSKTTPNATWGTGVTTIFDSISDATLLDNSVDDKIALYTQEGLPNARRFKKPPTNKPFIALHQDIMWYYGRVFYNEGTVAATNSNATITGTSTAVRSEMVGWSFRDLAGTVDYTVATVNEGAQTFTISPVYAGTTGSGKSYTLSPNAFDEAYLLRFSIKGEPESVPEYCAQRVQSSSSGTDIETGIAPYGAYLYLLHERTFYQASFGNNPAFDLSISPAYYRGCVNNRMWGVAEGALYLCDQKGPYRVRGGSIDDQWSSMPLRNYWDETIDWAESKRKWYFFSYEEHQRVLRWHVNFIGDSSTRPKRAVCYNEMTGEWWDEQYPFALGGAAVIDVDGKQRLVCASENDDAMLMFEGYADAIVQAALASGTLDDIIAGTTTLVDNQAAYTGSEVGRPLLITGGTGNGESSTVVSVPNATTLVVSPPIIAGTDSTYEVLSDGFSGTSELTNFSSLQNFIQDDQGANTGTEVGRTLTITSGTSNGHIDTIASVTTAGTIRYFLAHPVVIIVENVVTYTLSGAVIASGTFDSVTQSITTVYDAAVTFSASMEGEPFVVTGGRGNGTSTTVLAVLDSHTIQLAAEMNVDSTSTYTIDVASSNSPISWTLKTGCYEQAAPRDQDGNPAAIEVRREVRIQHIPTAAAASMTARIYKNRSETAEAWQMGSDERLFVYEQNSADITIRMQADRDGANGDPGFTNIALDSVVGDGASADRHVQIELSGEQSTEQIAIAALDMVGFE